MTALPGLSSPRIARRARFDWNALTSDPRQAGGLIESDLADLRERASRLRDDHWGKSVTFSRKVFLPLTTYCRNSCGYCVFVKPPGDPAARYMTPDEVVNVARQGEQAGCKEALFSLGERPELRHAAAASDLQRLGHASTIDYLVEACRLVLENSSLMPHVNAGALSADEIARLREVSGSMGMMLEVNSRRLLGRGLAHHRCPDKVPEIRMATLDAAGRQSVPFTTGILVGIGETWQERIETLHAINAIHLRHGHVQEVIVQNFRGKPGTAMAGCAEPSAEEFQRVIAIARLILDPSIGLQAPPNLTAAYEDHIGSGINDWGGVSPVTLDHINPERAWPALAELARRTAAAGHVLGERLCVYPAHFEKVAPAVRTALQRQMRADGWARSQFGEDGSHVQC